MVNTYNFLERNFLFFNQLFFICLKQIPFSLLAVFVFVEQYIMKKNTHFSLLLSTNLRVCGAVQDRRPFTFVFSNFPLKLHTKRKKATHSLFDFHFTFHFFASERKTQHKITKLMFFARVRGRRGAEEKQQKTGRRACVNT